ncbi:hypothetical protein Tco_0805755, partial [Tanacetum coccineum]
EAIIELAVEFSNTQQAKDDLRKAYAECKNIPQEKLASINTFLKEEA